MYRVEHGLSQTELGATLGVSPPYVVRLESGDQSPTLTRLGRRRPVCCPFRHAASQRLGPGFGLCGHQESTQDR
ncbi:MAG: helix-turn-helix domain-containing protein [Pseudonocardiaceae bacterium]